MVSRECLESVADLLLLIAINERESEVVKQILIEQDNFDPGDLFKILCDEGGWLSHQRLCEILAGQDVEFLDQDISQLLQIFNGSTDGIAYTNFLKLILPNSSDLLRQMKVEFIPHRRKKFHVCFESIYAFTKVIQKEITNNRMVDQARNEVSRAIRGNLRLFMSYLTSSESVDFQDLVRFFNLIGGEIPTNEDLLHILRRCDFDQDGKLGLFDFEISLTPHNQLRGCAFRKLGEYADTQLQRDGHSRQLLKQSREFTSASQKKVKRRVSNSANKFGTIGKILKEQTLNSSFMKRFENQVTKKIPLPTFSADKGTLGVEVLESFCYYPNDSFSYHETSFGNSPPLERKLDYLSGEKQRRNTQRSSNKFSLLKSQMVEAATQVTHRKDQRQEENINQNKQQLEQQQREEEYKLLIRQQVREELEAEMQQQLLNQRKLHKESDSDEEKSVRGLTSAQSKQPSTRSVDVNNNITVVNNLSLSINSQLNINKASPQGRTDSERSCHSMQQGTAQYHQSENIIEDQYVIKQNSSPASSLEIETPLEFSKDVEEKQELCTEDLLLREDLVADKFENEQISPYMQDKLEQQFDATCNVQEDYQQSLEDEQLIEEVSGDKDEVKLHGTYIEKQRDSVTFETQSEIQNQLLSQSQTQSQSQSQPLSSFSGLPPLSHTIVKDSEKICVEDKQLPKHIQSEVSSSQKQLRFKEMAFDSIEKEKSQLIVNSNSNSIKKTYDIPTICSNSNLHQRSAILLKEQMNVIQQRDKEDEKLNEWKYEMQVSRLKELERQRVLEEMKDEKRKWELLQKIQLQQNVLIRVDNLNSIEFENELESRRLRQKLEKEREDELSRDRFNEEILRHRITILSDHKRSLSPLRHSDFKNERENQYSFQHQPCTSPFTTKKLCRKAETLISKLFSHLINFAQELQDVKERLSLRADFTAQDLFSVIDENREGVIDVRTFSRFIESLRLEGVSELNSVRLFENYCFNSLLGVRKEDIDRLVRPESKDHQGVLEKRLPYFYNQRHSKFSMLSAETQKHISNLFKLLLIQQDEYQIIKNNLSFESDGELAEIFNCLDIKTVGMVTLESFRQFLVLHNIVATETTLRKVFAQFDKTGNEVFTIRDFLMEIKGL